MVTLTWIVALLSFCFWSFQNNTLIPWGLSCYDWSQSKAKLRLLL